MASMEFKAAVLCGGEGKRLRPLTYYFQKTMIPIGGRQKPLLEYIVRLLRKHGLKNIVLLVGYKWEQIKNYFEDGSRFSVKIEYVKDKPGIKGTAGALYNAYKEGVLEADNILVYYGDILSTINLSNVLEYHREKKAAATIVLSKGYRVRVGVAHIDSKGYIKYFEEKPVLQLPVSVGILVLRHEVFELLRDIVERYPSPDLMSHLIPYLMDKELPVAGYLTDEFWYDVGSIERYEKMSELNNVEEALADLLNDQL